MKGKILIYDDDEEILLLCKAILAKHGFETETLLECDTIINDLETIQPDLVLMDLWIPGLGGDKAVALIKQNEQLKNIPILLFSANADIGEIAEKVNADGFIAKPFEIETLIESIQGRIG
jgi:two-component system cell cycle response regulator DivK